jgi:pimeloyl-ACP methyl ester carboxylesterase
MRFVKWIVMGLAVIAVVAVAGGAVYQMQAMSEDELRFPMPGERIDIGGRSLHLVCVGEGTTTVLLENGLTGNYSAWLLVQSALAPRAKVCSYDRAGLGWSDGSRNPTRAEFVAADLHALRKAAKLDGPTILVGWSAGGVFARRYYHEHPDGIVGLVLVDSSHEQQRHRLPSGEEMEKMEAESAALLGWCRRLAWMGAVRISGAMEAAAIAQRIPDTIRAESVAMSNRTDYCTGVTHEVEGFRDDVSADTPPRSLGALPLIVLTRGRPNQASEFPVPVSQALLDEQDRIWKELQNELAALSSASRHRIVPNSGHSIPIDAPDAVVTAVNDLLGGTVRAAP